MEQESGAYHDMPTFSPAKSTYDWIKSLELYVQLGLITKERMEEMIKSKIK